MFDEFFQPRFPVQFQMVVTEEIVPTDLGRFTDIARDQLDEIQYRQGGWQGIRRRHPRIGVLASKVVNLRTNAGRKSAPVRSVDCISVGAV